jgi:hypothetical protein
VSIARENLVVVLECEEAINLYEGHEAFEHSEILSALKNKIARHVNITIVFSALALEAYIYDYGARNTSDSFVKKYLDKLDVVSKWVIVPQLVTGKEFPTHTEAFELLRNLIRKRNAIVHYKSSSALVWDQQKEEYVPRQPKPANRIQDAREAVEAIDKLAEIMDALDPDESAYLQLRVPSKTMGYHDNAAKLGNAWICWADKKDWRPSPRINDRFLDILLGYADIRAAQGEDAATAYLAAVFNHAMTLLEEAGVAGHTEGDRYLRV